MTLIGKTPRINPLMNRGKVKVVDMFVMPGAVDEGINPLMNRGKVKGCLSNLNFRRYL